MLAAAAAARLVTRLVDVQAAGRVPRLVLTGGGIGTALLEHLAHGPARDAVDWAHVEFYWGDERFLPAGDPERNETGRRRALLDHLPVDPARVHAMGADTGSGPVRRRGRGRGVRRAAGPARPPGGPRAGAGVRRHPARHGRGGAHRVGVPAAPPRCTRPSAPSSPCTGARSRRRRGVADAAGGAPVRRGVDPRHRRGEGRGGGDGARRGGRGGHPRGRGDRDAPHAVAAGPAAAAKLPRDLAPRIA